MTFPFPLLIADIGGTNARFAYQPQRGAPLLQGFHFKTNDYPGLEAVLPLFINEFRAKPRSMIACVAGPIEGRKVTMTNADWTIDGHCLTLNGWFEQGLLLNDFEAQALALPALRPEWTLPIGESGPPGHGVQLVMGLGTGFGVAALTEFEARHLAIASEAGHMDFGPIGADESALWPCLDSDDLGRITVETVLSGPGLARFHRARCKASHGQLPPAIEEAELVARARANPEGEEATTMRAIWALVARFSSDLALAFLAEGGVTFSGGVLPRLVPFLDRRGFRARFENKAPYSEILRKIRTRLILAEDYVLAGMARIADTPHSYAIDYSERLWR